MLCVCGMNRSLTLAAVVFFFAACGPPPMMSMAPNVDAGVFTFHIANVPFVPDAGPDVEINGPCAWDGETGDFCGHSVPYTVVEQMDPWNPKVGVFSVGKLRIGQNGDVVLRGAYPIIVVATGDITVVGSIRGQAVEVGGVAGGGRGVAQLRGPGPGGGLPANPVTHVGASGGAFCGVGGHGGNGAFTTSPLLQDFEPLRGGSAGGGSVSGAGSGNGGAALQLTSARHIRLEPTSVIYAGGGGGNAPSVGGGSGGMVLLEAETVNVLGTIVLNGGSGGASCATGIVGGDGVSARLDGLPAPGGQTAMHASGGAGSDVLNEGGGIGGDETSFCAGQPAVAGAGGGGSGYFFARTRNREVVVQGKIHAGKGCVNNLWLL